MKKKILGVLIAVVMLMCILTLAISAADDEYVLYVGGVQITDDNLTVDSSNCASVESGSATFDPATKTLLLDNFVYSGEGMYKWGAYSVIYTETPLNIALKGNSKISTRKMDGTTLVASATYAPNTYVKFIDYADDDAVGYLHIKCPDCGVGISGSAWIEGAKIFVEDVAYGFLDKLTVDNGGEFKVECTSEFVHPAASVSYNLNSVSFLDGAENYHVRVESSTAFREPLSNSNKTQPSSYKTFGGSSVIYMEITPKDPEPQDIYVNSAANGTLSVGQNSAVKGTKITVTATPNEGYGLDGITVTKAGDASTTVPVKDGKFTMPNYPVVISATFSRAYDLWVGGVQLTESKLTVSGDTGTATYDPDTNTLTLNNFTLNSSYDNGAIYSEDITLIIKVIGENTLVNDGAGVVVGPFGNEDEFGLTILGVGEDASLTVNATSNDGLVGAIDVWGWLYMEGCEIKATSDQLATTAISASQITAKNAVIEAEGTWGGIGVLWSYDGVISFTDCRVVAKGDTTTCESAGIAMHGGTMQLLITDSTVTAVGSNEGIYVEGWAGEGKITISGSTVTATGSACEAIRAGTLEIDDSTVTAEGDSGICVYGDTTFSDSTVTANATDDQGAGLAVEGDLTINGGALSATGGNFATAIYVENDIAINGGTVTATGAGGIYAESIAINDASVTAAGDYLGAFYVAPSLNGDFVVYAGDDAENLDRVDTPTADTYASKLLKLVPLYTVTVNYGVDGVENDLLSVEQGQTATLTAPSNSGYAFFGWFTDAGYTVPFDPETPITEDVTLFAKWVVAYNVWVGGAQFTEANLVIDGDDTACVTSGSATFDPTTNTLTLNGFTLIDAASNVGIYAEDMDLTVKLMGENVITTNNTGVIVFSNLSVGNLAIICEGEGASLAITSTLGVGITATYLTIGDGCTLTVTGFDTGIWLGADLAIGNGCTVTVSAGEDGIDAYDVTIGEGCTVTVIAADYGIDAYDLIIGEGCTLTVTADENKAIYASDVTLGNHAVLNVSSSDSTGMDASWLVIGDGCQLNVFAGGVALDVSYVVIGKNCTVTVSGGYQATSADVEIGEGTTAIFACRDEDHYDTMYYAPALNGTFIVYTGENADDLSIADSEDSYTYYDNAYIKILPACEVTVVYGVDGMADEVITVVKGERVSLTTPSLEGHLFGGWFADAEFATAFDASAPINADTTIYARLSNYENDQKVLKDAIAAVEAAIADKASTEKLTEEVGKLNDAIAAAKGYADTQDEALKSLLEAADDTMTAAISALQNRVTEIENQLDGIDLSQIEAGKTAIEALTAQLGAVKTTVDQLDNTFVNNDELSSAIAVLKGELESADEALDALVDALQNRVTALEAAKAELEGAVSALQTAVAGKADAATVNTAIANLQAAINALDAVKNNYVAADSALEATLNTAIETAKNAAINAASEALAEAKNELNAAIALKADTATVNAAIANLQAAINALDAVKNNYVAADSALEATLNTAIETAKNAAINAASEALTEAKNELNAAIANLQAAINALDAVKNDYVAADSALEATLNTAIETAKNAAINAASEALTEAKNELNAAIASGDDALDTKITNLTDALNTAKTVLEQADADNKDALVKKIEAADKALDEAIEAIEKSLDDAKDELNKAIADGDAALDEKIAALSQALADAKTALEASGTTNKNDLASKIDDADAVLQAAINALSSKLDTTNEKVAQLETFITVVCILSCVAIGGCGVLAALFVASKKKKI